jgi:hypothetical protein
MFILAVSIPAGYLSTKLQYYIAKNALVHEAYDFIDIFSTIALITFVLLFINQIGWKWSIFGWKPFGFLVDVQNLNGRYTGELNSSFNGGTAMLCVLEIKQNASRIKVYAYFGDLTTRLQSSKSVSVSEDLINEDNNTTILSYNFDNKSEPNLPTGNHFGAATLTCYPDKKLMGPYFNQKSNTGSINVLFQTHELKGRI